jgi:phospholipid/cholesterol/gamma-HCH transport system ATP-binding protein
MSEKISIHNLVKNFGDKEVLCGIDLQVHKGESLVVLGGSGSGKSVLIKIISTLISPTSGSIKIDGKSGAAAHEPKKARNRSGAMLHTKKP